MQNEENIPGLENFFVPQVVNTLNSAKLDSVDISMMQKIFAELSDNLGDGPARGENLFQWAFGVANKTVAKIQKEQDDNIELTKIQKDDNIEEESVGDMDNVVLEI